MYVISNVQWSYILLDLTAAILILEATYSAKATLCYIHVHVMY